MFGCHIIDLLTYLLNDIKVGSVECLIFTLVRYLPILIKLSKCPFEVILNWGGGGGGG